ncbi:NUDIX hydrolase [Pseudodonghicola flavimaris]|uniref:NUDIX hydrolase n=1 Tax=Pseudodonghicola flavimaris TaxID=3050036 RepID=A0ABT7EVR9_9RHOB|nr:NUDIX hydrolase [Pseudodonghicola flavimaris]MDK3016437.1 NUDIX hydrolase [Pseudodonghicola flavimaris]
MIPRSLQWLENVKLMLSRPEPVQLAALCYRVRPGKGTEVLLVTSSRGRWLLPKGWPITGLDSWETALQEAWEEAGVRSGTPWREPLTSFSTIKRHDNGIEQRCTVSVYPVEVREMREDYPEADRRERAWLGLAEACETVGEPALREVLQQFEQERAARA